jgi:hypothetical protein
MTVSQEESRPFALPHANQLLEDHPVWDAGFVATRMVRLSLGQEGTKLLEDWLDEIRWECRHGAYSFYSGSLDDSPDDVVSVPASHTETLFIEGSFKRRASFDVSHTKKLRPPTHPHAHVVVRGTRTLLFTEDYVQRV